MKRTYNVFGMTCNGCVASVADSLTALDKVTDVEVSLELAEASINMTEHIPTQILRSAISEKYTITGKGEKTSGNSYEMVATTSKWQQLKPLFLIFFYLFAATFLLNFRNWDTFGAMQDFMGLFFIVFSFFKLLDLKGFPESFRMYDPLAKVFPAYAWAYPFIEIALGMMFLMRFQINAALVLTIILLGITTYGVIRTLLDKKNIRCACLGTALKLPMTEATFIENSIMLVMAVSMLSGNLI